MHRVLVDKTFNQPINLAHFHERKASEFQSDGDFASAIEHHEQALALLKSMVQDSQDSQAKLSINLQCNFHRNRVKFLTVLIAKEVKMTEHYIRATRIFFYKKLVYKKLVLKDGQNLKKL